MGSSRYIAVITMKGSLFTTICPRNGLLISRDLDLVHRKEGKDEIIKKGDVHTVGLR